RRRARPSAVLSCSAAVRVASGWACAACACAPPAARRVPVNNSRARVCMAWRSGRFAQRDLQNVRAAFGKRSLAVGEVELPGAQEAGVEAELQHGFLFVQEAFAPLAQRAGVVRAEGELVDH